MTEPSTASPLGSVDKALLALDALAMAGPQGLALGVLADQLGVHKASLHRTLAALRYRGYVEQTATGTYRLGPAATALATTALAEENLPGVLHPLLVAVCDELGELAHLGALAGREIVYLDKVEPDRAVRVWSAVGRRRPAATTALGRALLAASLDDERLAWYADGYLPMADLAAEVSAARERGYAMEIESNEPGIGCVAVALAAAGRVVAAVSVTAPVDRVGVASLHRLGAALLQIATESTPTPLHVASLRSGM